MYFVIAGVLGILLGLVYVLTALFRRLVKAGAVITVSTTSEAFTTIAITRLATSQQTVSLCRKNSLKITSKAPKNQNGFFGALLLPSL